MESHATIASWDAPDRLTIYDATQYVKGVQGIVAQAFRLPRDNVRVICPFAGGAFGCKGPVWTHTILAVMAAKVVNRPVRVELTRQQMFSGTGHRTPTFQTIALAATRDGKLQAIRHHSEMVTSPVGDRVEPCGIGSTNVLYDAPVIEFDHVVHTVNGSQPSFMRRPENVPARMRSSARWMNWHTRLRWTRSSYGESTIRQITPSKGFHGQRNSCVNPMSRARVNLAGPDELMSRAQ